MSKDPPFFYPGGEYLDPKWTLIQEFIMKLSGGEYQLELPKDLGEDHLDSVLLALQLMGETLEGRERQSLASGAIATLEEGLVYVTCKGLVHKYNSKAIAVVGGSLQTGQHITKVIAARCFKKRWEENCEGVLSVEYWDMQVEGLEPFRVEVTAMDPHASGGHNGFLLRVARI